MDGSDEVIGIVTRISNADHAGVGNNLYGFSVELVGAADPDATETAIKFGASGVSPWDNFLEVFFTSTLSVTFSVPTLTADRTFTLEDDNVTFASPWFLVVHVVLPLL